MALTKEGEVYTWGRGDERLGIGETPDVNGTNISGGLKTKTGRYCAHMRIRRAFIVVASTGAVFAWGMGKYGKLGLSKGAMILMRTIRSICHETYFITQGV